MTVRAFKHNLVIPVSSVGTSFWKDEAIGLRNQMRGPLTYSGSPWKVSDVAEYIPPASTAHRGYVWLVRHSSGPEWLFVLASRAGTALNLSYTDFTPAIFRRITDNLTTLSIPVDLMMHYNTDFNTATYNMQFDDAVNLTYSPTDAKVFSSPNWPLDSSFYPAGTLSGTLLYTTSSTRGANPLLNRASTQFVFEDVGPSVSCVSFESSQTGAPFAFCSVGEIMDPVDPLDIGATRKSGAFGGPVSYALGVTSSTTQGNVSTPWARFFNTAGTAVNASNWAWAGDKTYTNEKTLSGAFSGRPIPVAGGTKGSLDSRFFLEAGAFLDYARYGTQMRTVNNDVIIRINGVNTIPWQSGVDFFAW